MDTPKEEPGQDVAALRAEFESVYSDLLTYEQACEVLGGISRYTLSRLVSAGKLSAVQVGRRRYITRAALAAYIKDVREAVRSDAETYATRPRTVAAHRPAARKTA